MPKEAFSEGILRAQSEMLIAIDTWYLSKRFRQTGTGVYLYNLLSQFLKIAQNENSGIEFHGFTGPNDDWAENGLLSPFLRVHETRALGSWRRWFFGGMAFNAAAVHPDLLFLPNSMGSIPNPFCPLVSTIHDVIPNRLPRELLDVSRLGQHLIWLSTKLARKIIAVSEWTKRDLVELYGLDPAKVVVTYEGYDRHLFNDTPPDPETCTALMDRFGVRRPYILHHGMLQLRKNVHRLIQAWDRVHALSKEFDAQLVLAGPMGLGHEDILRVREKSPHRDQVIMTGPLSDSDLAMVIKNASLCVIPSLYEGFCLPMLEAMACGVPTVASNSSCLPEVSGRILEYFDPLSVEEMAEVIRRALEDSVLRSRLREGGLMRAAQFSWERCAYETLRVFTETHLEYSPANEARPKRRPRTAI